MTPTANPTATLPQPTTIPTTAPQCRSERIALLAPRTYSNVALHQFAIAALLAPRLKANMAIHLPTWAQTGRLPEDQHIAPPLCCAVIHLTTGKAITKYKPYKKTHYSETPGHKHLEKNLATLLKATQPPAHPAPTPSLCSHTTK